MRVVAGDLRGRRIESPVDDATRPTTDKVREAVFNSLTSLGAVEGAVVWDLFAGTGAMGIEALSRGAERCVFVENSKSALTVLRANIDALALGTRSRVVSGSAIGQSCDDADIVIADPPYGFDKWNELLERLGKCLVVAESGGTLPSIDDWDVLRERKYGRTVVTFLRRMSAQQVP
ncbi:MAG: 16S rRNA (guanine(966)-N(2))-methyltransferase RsmD [Ilumatobacteraceae bacterium]|jgi:16S rRNA (guanine966-N2)-methyltransferase|nr:16S rRNA (guanine(966)-N(2))-methyltransferase RsmD [Ilumatobacteraceae bacterium]